jgi:hypothetical protein
MQIETGNYNFLLGGHDLEMLTIKELLKKYAPEYNVEDRNLEWGAKLSDYEDLLNDRDIFVGIELLKDTPVPKHYIEIDHHNENIDKASSLEQVIELLKNGLNQKLEFDKEYERYLKLVSANDSGYIPVMLKAGANLKEAMKIRKLDRKAQGVTEKDEELAVESLKSKETIKGIIVIKALTEKFSTITDQLYPCKQLLIYSDHGLSYYGEGAKYLALAFNDLIIQGKAYSGGTGNGFFGLTSEGIVSLGGIKPARKKVLEILTPETPALEKTDTEQLEIEQQFPENKPFFSYHIFIFPFKWNNKETEQKPFSERFVLKDVKKREDSNWINLPNPITPEYAIELYNEKNFFYEFVHPVLYDEGINDDSVVLHFERKEAYENRQLFYEIDVIANKSKRYRLNLKSIGLNLYSTGTGSLVFYLENNDHSDFEDILRINQYGRRILPPFLGFPDGIIASKKAELANHIAITGLNGEEHRYIEDFANYTEKTDWKPARFIESLIDDFNKNLEIKPVTDDRMHVLCWYGNDKMSESIKGNWLKNEGFKNDWYRFLFVDGGEKPTCKDEKMKKDLIKRHTYSRWQQDGNLYGLSRYSMVFISNESDFCKKTLLTHFRTIYTRMVELSLVQRASILKFSDEVTRLSKLKNVKYENITDEIGGLYKAYIRFVNQIYFREVTAQEQGIELYNMVQEKMKIAEQVKDLDDEIEELHNYANLLEQKEQEQRIAKITILGAIFLPATFLVGLFGINTMPEPSRIPNYLFNGKIHWPFWISLGVIIALTVILIILIDLIGRFGVIFKKRNQK